MHRIALLAVTLFVGCAPAVRYSECDPNTVCPDGTVCQQISPQHASCTTPCRPDGPACEGGAGCLPAPYQIEPSTRTWVPYRPGVTVGLYVCQLPCDAQQRCPSGLACTMTELQHGASLWCL